MTPLTMRIEHHKGASEIHLTTTGFGSRAHHIGPRRIGLGAERFHRTNGLDPRSSPIAVTGPWPGRHTMASPNVYSLSLMP